MIQILMEAETAPVAEVPCLWCWSWRRAQAVAEAKAKQKEN
jgi:hypothetical protein